MRRILWKSNGNTNPQPEKNSAEKTEDVKNLSTDGSAVPGSVSDGVDGAQECGGEGIKVTYVLKKEEIYECLKNAGTLKTGGKVFIIINSVITALTIAFLIYGKISGKASYFFISAVLVSFLLIFGIFPIRINHIRAESSADGHTICMRIFPEHIELGRGTNKLNIPLDGTAESTKVGDMIVLVLNVKNGSRMVILPLRCLDPTLARDVQADIFSGTKPKKARIGLL